jgi:hypothetical protein
MLLEKVFAAQNKGPVFDDRAFFSLQDKYGIDVGNFVQTIWREFQHESNE